MANRITTLIEFKTDQARTSLRNFSADIKKADGATGKFKAGMSGIGQLFRQNSLEIAGAGAAVGAALYKMAEGAADTQANFSALNQVVGADSANNIADWAKGAAKEVGLARGEVFEAATTFGMFGKEAGLAGDELETFITDQIKLASDFAAFKNAKPQDVVNDIRAAYAGSSETLQKYIGTVNDAAIKQAYFDKTGEKVTGTLTGQQRVIGINTLMFEKGADMIGQFSRESGELAGQQAIAAATFKNVSDTIGEAVLPAVLELGDAVVDLAPQIEAMALDIVDATEDIRLFAEGIQYAAEKVPLLEEGTKGLGFVLNPTGKMFDYVKGKVKDFNSAITTSEFEVSEYYAQLYEAKKAGDQLSGSTGELEDEQTQLSTSTEALRSHYARLYDQFKRTNRATQDNTRSQELAARAADDHKRKVDALTQAYDRLTGEIDAERTWINLSEALYAAGGNAEITRTEVLDLKDAVIDYGSEVANLPPEQVTAILADIDAGRYAEALALLAELEKTRTATINIVTRGGTGGANNRAFARGTPSAPKGLALVGEEGPELVEFRGGEKVHTASQTRQMLSSGSAVGGGGNIYLTVNAGMGADGRQVGRQVVEALREYKRSGGSVSF